MARHLFGTDGIRGRANTDPMTAPIAMSTAMAAARLFRRGAHRHRVVIGKDTRLSGYMIEPALTAGFIAQGMDVILLGPLPTPAVAMLTKSLRADLGVMISASHNPFEDNGIKIFGPDGYKLSDDIETQIEALMDEGMGADLAASADLGRASRLDGAVGRYVEFIKSTSSGKLRLDGLKIVVDCANGAAYKAAPQVLWELGADVIPVAVAPDGRNINLNCGATHTQLMREAVLMHGADIGLALDGDADRLIMADEKGQIIDGDQLMAMIASTWAKAGTLRGGKVVATVMSNLGFERFLAAQGVSVLRTPVGDRYVVEAMRAHDCNVGGEQSGHMVLSDFSTTGDGLLAALQILTVLRGQDRPASEACQMFQPLPQILKNVRAPGCVLENEAVQKALAATEETLKGKGRLLVRKSGTEPLIRVMAEGEDAQEIEGLVDGLIELIAAQGASDLS